jgi:urate oxidase
VAPPLRALQATLANHHSRALQHTLYDLARFGLENHNEVFHADDRPYGLIETTVLREGAISELDPG